MKLARTLIVYFLTFGLNAAFSFITFSITTHFLSAEDLGYIYLYNSCTVLLVPFIGIGTQFVLSVDYFKFGKEQYRNHFSNGLMIPVLSTIIFTVVFLLLYYPLRHIIPFNFFFTVLLPLNCFLVILNEIVLSLIRNKDKPYLFAGFSIGRNLLEIGLTLFFIVGLSMKWEGRLYSAITMLMIASIFALYLFRRWNLWSSEIRKKEVRSIAITGLPFIPERLSIFVLAYSAGFFIDHFKGTTDVGYYSSGVQIANIVNVSILALITLFQPFIFKNLGEFPNYPKLRKATLAFIGIALAITLIVVVASPLVFRWFIGPRFRSGSIYAINLSIAYFFWSVYAVFMSYLLYIRKNHLIMMISIVGMVLSVVLNAWNVSHFGALGATYTSILVYFCMAAMMTYFVNKFFNLRQIFFTSAHNPGTGIGTAE